MQLSVVIVYELLLIIIIMMVLELRPKRWILIYFSYWWSTNLSMVGTMS